MTHRPSFIAAKDFPPLSNYRCRAEIDWLAIRIVTKSPTNFPAVQRALAAAFGDGKMRSVTPINPNAGGGATEFQIRLQDPPSSGGLLHVFKELERKIPFLFPPTVIAIEVAVDFYSQTNNPLELRLMLLRLKREFAHTNSSARQYFGQGIKVQFLSKDGARMDNCSTLYVGNKTDPIFWRIYLKTTDNNMPIIDSRLHRARIEVNLSGQHLQNIGSTIESLSWTRFERLAKFFKCRTFMIPASSDADCKTLLEQLQKMALHSRMWEWRAGQGKLQVPKRRKYSPDTQADVELNTRIRGSLRALTERFGAKKRGGIAPRLKALSPRRGRVPSTTLITTITLSPSMRASGIRPNANTKLPSSHVAGLPSSSVENVSTQ